MDFPVCCDSHNSQSRSADALRGNSFRQRIGYILDCKKFWKIRQQCNRSESFARITDIHMSGPIGKNPCLIQNGVPIQCNTENYVPIVVPGLSTASSSSSSSATPTSLPQESTGSIPIPSSVDNKREEEKER